MADFPIFHGITLADNSYIENLHIERLAADPVPVNAGRVWYNLTDKAFKFSTLDAGGAVIVRTFPTLEAMTADLTSLSADLSAETTRATAAEGTLQSNLDTEAATRAAADTALGARIDALGSAFNYVGTLAGGADAANALDMAALTQKDAGDYYKVAAAGYFKVGTGAAFYANVNDGLVWNLVGNIDKIDNTNSDVAGTADYIAVSGSADTGFTVDVDAAFKGRVSTLESGLAQELLDRAAADTALQGELDATQAAAGLNADGSLTAFTGANYVSSATTLRAAVSLLDVQAKTEADALAAESSARSTADTALDGRITALEGAVDGATGDLATLTTDAKDTLVAAINEVDAHVDAEVTARADADTAIRTDYNARRFTFASASAATSHTVTHNLGSQFVDFTVLVERPDGKFRNDVVSVEEVDSNTLKVYLSVAANVKLAVTSMVGL